MYETLKEAGYKYKHMLKPGAHVLWHPEYKKLEVWYSNKSHASYGLKYKNTHLEFGFTLKHSSDF